MGDLTPLNFRIHKPFVVEIKYVIIIYSASCETARKCVMFPLDNGIKTVFISKLLIYSRGILPGKT